jgi:DNA repair protein RadA/Sms
MAKLRTVHRCQRCGGTTPKWAGRCPECEGWNTLVEELEAPATGAVVGGRPVDRARPIGEVDRVGARPRPTGVGELDRVLGGGLVPGSVSLLGGEPGIGKSTLLLEAAGAVARGGGRVLYVAAEEATHQVRCRADRLGAIHPDLWLASETVVPHIVDHLDAVDPAVVVIDSIQAVHDPALTSAPGSVAQVRDGAARFVREAKRRDVATVLVGHVTKDGALAGPRVLEHVVDTVLAFEGDRHDALRLLRAVKHRFGPTDQLGLFEMTGAGLAAVADPSRLFLADRRPGQVGSVVVPLIEGRRPLLVEVQALTAPSSLASPRRSAQGLDAGRLAVLLAVLDRRAGVATHDADVFTLAVGGVRVAEPAADLALALAVASSRWDRPIPPDVVAMGELGLGGEVRQVTHTDRRLAEAARLGFRRAVVPRSVGDAPDGMTLLRAGSLSDALGRLGLGG